MNDLTEDLARAQMSARLGEAQQLRRGHQLARGRRLTARPSRPRSRRVSPCPRHLSHTEDHRADRAPAIDHRKPEYAMNLHENWHARNVRRLGEAHQQRPATPGPARR